MNSISGITLRGIKAMPVEIEVETTGGLFVMSIVGLPDTAVKEARERVRAALRSVGVTIRGRVAINLAPADIPKEGALLDLPIAVAIAASQAGVKVKKKSLFLGELALDGRLRKSRGAVAAAFLAKQKGWDLYVPAENEFEVGLVKGVKAFKVNNLGELIEHFRGEVDLPRVQKTFVKDEFSEVSPDFAEIKGQTAAKRALEVAAAGHHNLLLVGSPGSGKTMLARAMRGILPPLSDEELMEVMLLRSREGLVFDKIRERPFRSVHHTASTVALCGGGRTLRPGEISLASRGVLFLDEFPEFTRDVLESLRQPLEDGCITVSRVSGSVVYPAKVLLIAACNPCPCGYAGDPVEQCTCSPAVIERYTRRLSGPILDRIDLHISVPRLTPEELIDVSGATGESSSVVKARVCVARKIQAERWGKFGFYNNAEIPERLLRKYVKLSSDVRKFILMTLKTTRLSGRGISKVLKVARTIADLDGACDIEVKHVAEAMSYREEESLCWMKL